MEDDKWKWISVAVIFSVALICATIGFINQNPFEFSFIADDNNCYNCG